MPVRHEEALAGASPGSKVAPLETNVLGTGFLVRAHLVLTNRHVVETIAADHKQSGSFDHWYVRFTYPRSAGGITETTQRIVNAFAFVDPAGAGRFDAGLLEFKRVDHTDFSRVVPVEFGELDTIKVGIDIGVCGFPLGNALLLPTTGLQRFGPVVHHGIVSGVAPFDVSDPRRMSCILTDVNSAGGMSGSPVFTISNGNVIGLHFAGHEGTAGCAIPVDAKRVETWVRFYERIFVHGETPQFPTISGGGDIVN
jgi:V8-like Glu-specific endopeptidase